MAGLDDAVKAHIVRALACFESPSNVAKSVKDEFGVEITRQHCERYDPTKAIGSDLGKKWTALFEETRARFLSDTAAIGIAHRAVRLKRLERMADKAESMGAIGLAASLMEQAAKEVGEAYTNKQRHELTGKDGAPIMQQTTAMTVEEFTKAAESVLSKF